MSDINDGLSPDELAAQEATALPDKEVFSILDLNADLDLAIDAAAPIDLGVAANANVAAPIDASVGANVLSTGSDAQALSDQGVLLGQGIHGDATAHSTQVSGIDQGGVTGGDAAATGDSAAPAASTGGTLGDAAGTVGDTAGTVGDTAGGTLGDAAGTVGDTAGGTVGDAAGTVGDTAGTLGADGNLLNVNVNLDGKAGIAAPIDGAVAANANVAAPIDGSVAANVGSVDSHAVSVAQQDAIINQQIDGDASATTDQTSDITQ